MYFSVKGIVKVMFIVILCSLLVRGPQFEKCRRPLPLEAKFRAVCVSNCALRHPQPQQSGRQHIVAVHSQNHVARFTSFCTSQCTDVEYFSALTFFKTETLFSSQ